MSYTDFTQTPSYQRMMQKLQKIRPEQRAVLNTLSMDEKFADEATRRALATMAQVKNTEYANKVQGMNKDYSDKTLTLRGKELASGVDLRRRVFETDQDQNRMATGIGLGQVIAEADYGRRRDAIDLEVFKKKMAFADRLGQLYGGA